MIILSLLLLIFIGVVIDSMRKGKIYKAFIKQQNITVTRQQSIGRNTVTEYIVLDDVDKKLYHIIVKGLIKIKVRYSEIKFSDIVKCQTYVNGQSTTAGGLGLMVSAMPDDKLIRRAGITVITNDIKAPSISFDFIDDRKGTQVGSNSYTLGNIGEWASVINMVANNKEREIIY